MGLEYIWALFKFPKWEKRAKNDGENIWVRSGHAYNEAREEQGGLLVWSVNGIFLFLSSSLLLVGPVTPRWVAVAEEHLACLLICVEVGPNIY